jgi:hypothetical protein
VEVVEQERPDLIVVATLMITLRQCVFSLGDPFAKYSWIANTCSAVGSWLACKPVGYRLLGDVGRLGYSLLASALLVAPSSLTTHL